LDESDALVIPAGAGWVAAQSQQAAWLTGVVISPKIARHHIEHIYAKVGAFNQGERQPVRHAARPASRRAPRHDLTMAKMRQLPHAT
jgi:hypothetical protein